MERQLLYELIGYVASVVVAVSLMMSSILRLRIINLAGSSLFSLYGFMIGAIPVGVLNAFIALINIYYLAQIYRSTEYFRLLQVQPDAAYLHYFLDFSGDDIRRYYPGFDYRPAPGLLTFFVLRDLVPAGVMIAEPAGEGTLRLRLDYVLPGYRDFKVARFVFREHAEFFRERGFRRIVASAPTREHAAYFRKVGFRPAASPGSLELLLTPGR